MIDDPILAVAVLLILSLPLAWIGRRLHPSLYLVFIPTLAFLSILLSSSLLDWWKVIVFCLSTLMVLVLGPLFIDGTSQILAMNKEQRRATVFPTLKLSILPIFVVFLAIFVGLKIQEKMLDRTLYSISATSPGNGGFGCNQTSSALVCTEFDHPRLHPEEDVEAALVRMESRLALKVNSAIKSVIDAKADAKKAERSFYTSVLNSKSPIIPHDINGFSKELVLETPCDTVHFIWSLIKLKSNCIKNSALYSLNNLYISLRMSLRDSYDEKMRVAGVSSGQSVEVFERAAQSFVEDDLGGMFSDLRDGISHGFIVLALVNTTLICLQLFVLAKIIFLLFARFLFHPDHGARPIQALSGAASQKTKSKILTKDITRHRAGRDGSHRGFSLPVKDRWHVFPRGVIKPVNEGHLSVPHPLQLTMARIFRGCYLATSYEKKRHSHFGAVGDANSSFIVVRLRRGQQLAIRVENLFAFTEGVRLKSIYDYTLSALTYRRLFLHVVEGAGADGGWVVLSTQNGGFQRMRSYRAEAEREATGQLTLHESTSPEGIIAFDPAGAFVLDADTSLLGSYKGNYSLWPANDETTAIYATTRKQYRGWIMLKRLLLILLPLPF